MEGTALIQTLAAVTMLLWEAVAFGLGYLSILNAPILSVFAAHRLVQLFAPGFDRRPTVPTHALLHLFCAVIYGLVMPAFYFLSTRQRNMLAFWPLGSGTNTWWTITLGVICLAWLASHLAESALRGGRLRFGPGWADRLIPLAGTALCLWFHARTAAAVFSGAAREDLRVGVPPIDLFLQLLYPQSCFLGATLVYGFAAVEAWRARTPLAARRWRRALALGAGAVLVLFAPLWLSLPRVTHRQAMAMLREHRGMIAGVAQRAALDPRLLAGIIYVAQTRDHPRFTGDLLEEFQVALMEGRRRGIGLMDEFSLLDASTGLCQVKPSTALQTVLGLSSLHHWHAASPAAGIPPAKFRKAPPADRQSAATQPSWRFGRLSWELPVTAGDLRKPLAQRVQEFTAIAGPRQMLLTPKGSLLLAAAMLDALRAHWRRGGFPIDGRPEILATLYNLGYERSRPHGAPRPNDFGRRVAAFMESDACRRLFEGKEPR